jgi:methylated-DNA-[protein]-cysteine S-methyltransferase
MAFQQIVETPLGLLLLKENGLGLEKAWFVEEQIPGLKGSDFLVEVALAFTDYFDGKKTQFDFPIHPIGTAFQLQVWAELQKIPFGSILSYTDLAKRLGDPKKIRAAASANGKNPLGIIIPCHRVIGAKGDLVGYAGGIHRKEWLLQHEGWNKQTSLF